MSAAAAALCFLAFLGAVTHEIWPRRGEVVNDVAAVFASPAPAEAAPAPVPASERPVYRHSIVPGGAYSRGELVGAIRADAVVAAHYEHIDVDKIRPKTVTAAREVYVSYRVGDRVFWTKNRVRLSPGERLLTDGTSEIRARCGNLVSDQARQPVAGDGPPLAALDEVAPETGSSTIAGERDAESQFGDVPSVPMLSGRVPLGGAGLVPGLPGIPVTPGSGGGAGAPYFAGSSTGTGGMSLVAPLGNSGRRNGENGPNGGGSNGGGSNGGGSNGGGSNGGGSNGGGSNGGGSNGGGPNGGGSNGGGSNGGGSNGGGSNGGGSNEPPPFVPETTTGTIETTGNIVVDTGDGETDGDVPTVPEPATMTLLTLGAIAAAARKVRSRR
jgi:hypothetical protein